MADTDLLQSWERHTIGGRRKSANDPLNLLVLPGSRKSEVRALLNDFQKAVATLAERGTRLSVHLPTLPHLETMVRQSVESWPGVTSITITTGRQAQMAAFSNADAALAASGTVTLELALAGIPAVSCYRTDPVFRMVAGHMVTTWSAALPNIIADRPVINEYYDHLIHPGMLARMIEELSDAGSRRYALTMDGYAEVRRQMIVDRPPAEKAAEIIASILV